MPRLATRVPKYRLHRATGQAVVHINGRDVYLGNHDSDQSRVRYDAEIAAFIAARAGQPIRPQASKASVTELIAAFWSDREKDYLKDGKPTGEHGAFRIVLKRLRHQFGSWSVDDLGPLALKSLRQSWVDDGLARLTCNRCTRKAVEVFRWGVENEYVAPDTWHALKSVKGLRKGRTSAPEPAPVSPVELDRVEAVMPHLSPVLQSMIRMQLMSGARPGEVCSLRPCDVDRSEDVWIFVPSSHKTEHHGKRREIYLGPDAQSVLLPYLLRASDAHCFSAAESKEWYREQRAASRTTPPSCGNARGRKHDARKGPGTRAPRSLFDTSSYGQAIAGACRKAWPPPKSISSDEAEVKAWEVDHTWSPNQLRHARATEVRKRYGLEAAQVILGHAKADVTQIYAERDRQLGMRVAGESG